MTVLRLMLARRALRRILAELGPGPQAKLADVVITLRGVPTAIDYARGATDDQRGYFYGEQLERPSGTDGISLPDEDLPSGEIVLFVDRIDPFSELELARTIVHELAHVFGYDEDEVIHELELGAPLEEPGRMLRTGT